MMQSKICMVGAFAVGKTSLVARFVESIFSEKYHTTVGVKISKKVLKRHDEEWQLLLWDLAGEDEFMQVRTSYLRGAAGYLLVVDGTRRATLDVGLGIRQRITETVGDLPCLVLVNKADVESEWDVGPAALEDLGPEGTAWLKTSAKTGGGVDAAFETLLTKIQER